MTKFLFVDFFSTLLLFWYPCLATVRLPRQDSVLRLQDHASDTVRQDRWSFNREDLEDTRNQKGVVGPRPF